MPTTVDRSIISLKGLLMFLTTAFVLLTASTLENLSSPPDPRSRVPLSRLLQPLICTMGLVYFVAEAKVVEFLRRRGQQWLLQEWDRMEAALLRIRKIWKPNRVVPSDNLPIQVNWGGKTISYCKNICQCIFYFMLCFNEVQILLNIKHMLTFWKILVERTMKDNT